MKLRFFWFVLFVVFMQPGLGWATGSMQLDAPDGSLRLRFDWDESGLTYAVFHEDQAVVEPTAIAVTLDGVVHPQDSATPRAGEPREVQNKVKPLIPHKHAALDEVYREQDLIIAPGISIRARVYNDAVAFRWMTDLPRETVVVDEERFALTLPDPEAVSWVPDPNGRGFFSHHESMVREQPVNRSRSSKFCVPMMVEADRDLYLLVTDVDVEHYPGLWLERKGDARFDSIFPPYPKREELKGDRDLNVAEAEPYIARIPGRGMMPWRVLLVTTAEGLLESETLWLLAEPSRIKDTDWIKPGLVQWEWWNSFALRGVDFDPGVNQLSYKHYIDFASENGIPYLILDEGWSRRGPENLLSVIGSLDMLELMAYAREKNVGLILWMTSTALMQNFDEAFAQFSEWGVAGIKVDFMQRDDQVMNEWCYKVAEEAARRRMVVDFHGGAKPTGMSRTYPHVLTQESVMGLEQARWSDRANPEMSVINAFLRMTVGPMDYTPGAMINMSRETFVPGRENRGERYKWTGSMGTRCHQLAMYVVYVSPLQMLCDTPTNYRENPESLAFIREVPVVWHETVALHADPMEAVAVARRHGDTWYIGALTDYDGREITLDLSFLGEGEFTMTAHEDGPAAATEATDYTLSTRQVNGGDTLKVTMAPGGGFAAVLKPAP